MTAASLSATPDLCTDTAPAPPAAMSAPVPAAPAAAAPAPLAALAAALKRHAAAFGVFSVATTALLLVPTLYMLQVYDRVLGSRNLSTLILLTLLVLGLYAVLSALEAVRGAMCSRLAVQAERLLAPAVFRAALDRPDAGARSHLLMADLGQVRQAIAGPLPGLLFDVPLAVVFVAAAFAVDTVLGLFVAGCIGLLGGLALWQLRVLQPLQKQVGQAQAQAGQALAEASRQHELVHAMGMQPALEQRWLAHQSSAAALHLASSAAAHRTGAALRLARLATQSLALAVGAWLVLEQRISLGMMVAASVLLGRALTPVEGLIAQGRSLLALRESWRRLAVALVAPPAAARMALPAPTGHLQAVGIGLTVTNTAGDDAHSAKLLQDVAFTLAPGQAMAIVGNSGAGKSTLARILGGALPATSGQVRLDGAELAHWPAEQRGRAIGVLPQEVHLFDGTVAENIARLGEVDSAAVLRAAARAGVHDMILRLPQGYQTRIGPSGMPLSGGQRQRIGLARALYGDPVLLVLDEPNAHVDEAGDVALSRAIAAHKAGGGSAVVVSHRLALLPVIDRILVLHGGRVQRFGERNEVLRSLQPDSVAARRGPVPASA